MSVKISVSILSANFTILKEEISKIEQGKADYLHIDVMDGHFVPNLTIGPCVISTLRSCTKMPFDVHLMIDNVEECIDDFIKAGADIITFHHEAVKHAIPILNKIRAHGKKVGIALIPTSLPEELQYIIDYVDRILIMSVSPGFGGQEFIHKQLQKISYIKNNLITDKNIELVVDGGITRDNARRVVCAGADVLVSGSEIFRNKDYAKNIAELRSLSNIS